MSVDRSRPARPAPPARRAVAAALVVAAAVSAATFVRYSAQLSELGAGFADVDLLMRICAWLYGLLAAAVLAGALLLSLRVGPAVPLLLAVLVPSVPVQALVGFMVVADCSEVLDGGVRIVGDRSVALAAAQVTAVVATALLTAATLALLLTRRRRRAR